MNLWVIFITGLTVGGLTCLAVQGGLLASVITAREEEEIKEGVNKKNTILPTLAFLVAKLLAYIVVGSLLGAFGGAIGISQNMQILMQAIAGFYMIAIALNLLNIHPLFRYAVIQPPKFLVRRIRSQSKSKDLFAPLVLGVMTIFIPCGTTLAMEALAISSANPFTGAAIMAVFVLGTSPLFFGVGWLTSVLGNNFRTKFLKLAAFGVMYLGVMSVNGSLVASGSPFTLQKLADNVVKSEPEQSGIAASVSGGFQQVVITVTEAGYTPQLVTVMKGHPVQLTLIAKDAYTCASAFRIPSLQYGVQLPPNGARTLSFTPTTTGDIPFTCSMGMYTGVIRVI